MAKRKKVSQTKRERGRPQKLDESDLTKIRELASAGLTLPEMASMMGVSRTAIETLLKNSLDLKDEIQTLRKHSKALAKIQIHQALEAGDSIDLAKWVLERDSKLTSERERLALMRAQRKALEPSKEDLPEALPSVYWAKVDRYFSSQYQSKPEQTEAGEASDNAGDQTSKQD